jgi:hypothetical protein
MLRSPTRVAGITAKRIAAAVEQLALVGRLTCANRLHECAIPSPVPAEQRSIAARKPHAEKFIL